MDIKASYYAVIPAEVRYCKDLPPNAKLLYGEITALASTDKGCFARNKYFAKLYDVSVRTIQQWLELLENKGFIERSTARANDTGLRAIRLKSAPLPTYEQESYDEIFASCGVYGELKAAFIRFIKHCNLNGRMITNEKMYSIITRLDFAHGKDTIGKIASLDRAIDKGYFDVAEDFQ